MLGDMFELGKHSAREHRQLGKSGSARRSMVCIFSAPKRTQVRRGALREAMGAGASRHR